MAKFIFRFFIFLFLTSASYSAGPTKVYTRELKLSFTQDSNPYNPPAGQGLFKTQVECEQARPELEKQFFQYFELTDSTSECALQAGLRESYALLLKGTQPITATNSPKQAHLLSISPVHEVRESTIRWLKEKASELNLEFVADTRKGGVFYSTEAIHLDRIHLELSDLSECWIQAEKMKNLFQLYKRQVHQVCALTNIGRELRNGQPTDVNLYSLVSIAKGNLKSRKNIADQQNQFTDLTSCLDHLKSQGDRPSRKPYESPSFYFCSYEKSGGSFSYQIVQISL